MHKHHVIPRHEWKVRFGSLDGFNADDNTVFLTVEQHAQAHLFLFELNHSEYDLIASQTLSGQIGKEEAIRRVVRYANLGNSNRLGRGLGLIPWNKGKSPDWKFSPEMLAKLKRLNSGVNHPQYGTKHSVETRLKMRESRLRYIESHRSI